MIKAVVFDFDGTLVDFENTDILCLLQILKDTGSNSNSKEFIDRAVIHILNFHDLVISGQRNPLTLHQFRLSRTFSDFRIPWDEYYVERYRRLLVESTVPYSGITNLLGDLFGKVKLGILTNAYDPVMQMRRIRAAGLLDYFDEIQISGEEEFFKPDPRAFQKIARNLGVSEEECVFIGDSQRYDIDGALAAGMQGILLQPSHRAGQQSAGKSIEQAGVILRDMIP